MTNLFKGGLHVNHFSRLGCVWGVPGVQHGDAVLLDFLLEETELSLHLVAPANLVDKLALEGVGVRIQIAKLDQT